MICLIYNVIVIVIVQVEFCIAIYWLDWISFIMVKMTLVDFCFLPWRWGFWFRRLVLLPAFGKLDFGLPRALFQLSPDAFQSKSCRNKANLRDLIAATGLVILLKLDSNRQFFSKCDLEILWMTPKNNRTPLLYYIELCASFQIHQWIQTGVTVWKCSI